MQALEQAFIDLERVVACYLQDVGHRVSVAGQGKLGLLACIKGWLALNRGDDVIERGQMTFCKCHNITTVARFTLLSPATSSPVRWRLG